MIAKKTLIASAIVVAGAATLGFGAAVADRMGPGARWERIDTDGNGRISQQEANAVFMQRFEGADADNDGTVTREEAEAKMLEHVSKRFDRFWSRVDSDGDGQIVRGDAEAKIAERFVEADADGDGELTPREVRSMRHHGGGFGGHHGRYFKDDE